MEEFRRSLVEVFCKKAVLQIFEKITWKKNAMESFFTETYNILDLLKKEIHRMAETLISTPWWNISILCTAMDVNQDEKVHRFSTK